MQRRSGGRGLGAVLFTDIVGSTAVAAEMGDTRWSELVARHHRIVRRTLQRYGGHEVDTAGDGFFVTFERPADSIRCAVAIEEAVRELGIEVRAGVAFGEIETTGRKPSGLVVNTAARVMSVAGPGEVLVPSSVRELVPGAGIAFAEHGLHQLKGLDGEFRLFKVTEVDGAAPAPPLDVEEASERRREIFPAARRRGPLIAGLAAAAIVAVVVGSLIVSRDPATAPPTAGRFEQAVAILDVESGELRSPIPVRVGGAAPWLGDPGHPLAAGEGAVWLLRPPLLLQLDPRHAEIRSDRIEVGPSRVVFAGLDAVWVQTVNTLYRIHPGTGEPTVALELPPPGGVMNYGLSVSDVVWVGVSDGTIARVDPRTQEADTFELDEPADTIAASREALWVHDVVGGTVTRLDPETVEPVADPIHVEGAADRIAASDDALWLVDRAVGLVQRVGAQINTVNGSARVGDEPSDVALGLGSFWVGDRDGTLYRVDETTMRVTEYALGAEILGVTVDARAERLWVWLGREV